MPCLKHLVLALCLLLIGYTDSSSQWDTLSTGTITDFKRLKEAPGGAIYGMGNHWYKSIDAGDTWTYIPIQISGIPLGVASGDIHFFTADHALVASSGEFGNYYAVLETNDDGANWGILHWENVGGWPKGFRELEFPTPSVGYAAGTFGKMKKSTNGGSSWSLLSSGTTSEISGMYFWNLNGGVIVSDTRVNRTSNGGNNWNTELLGQDLHGLGFLSSGEMYTAGDATFYTSTDLGLTWVSSSAPFIDVTTVFAIHPDTIIVGTESLPYITTNGGAHWELMPAPADFEIHDIMFISPSTGFACGEDGRIVRTTNGVGAGVPIPAFDQNIVMHCDSTVVDLSATSDPGYSMTWLLNGQQIGIGPTVSYTFLANGPSLFGLIADNGTYSDTLVLDLQVTVDEAIDIMVLDTLVVCPGTPGILSASGADSYVWDPPTGLSDPNIADPEVNILSPMTYAVMGTSGACTDVDSTHVMVEDVIADPNWDMIFYDPNITFAHNGEMDWTDNLHGYMFLDRSILFKTSDGGLSWSDTTISLGQEFNPHIQMLDPLLGYLANDYLIKTEDGWETFQSINSGSMGYEFNDVYFLNTDSGFAMAGDAWKIFKTTNSGTSWQQIFSSGGSGRLYKMLAFGMDTIFASGGGGAWNDPPFVVYTYDGGVNWTTNTITTGIGNGVDITANRHDHLFISSSGEIHRSLDKGITWELVWSGSNGGGSIEFTESDTGYAAGGGAYKILMTIDGGSCWQPVFNPIPNGHRNICASSASRVHTLGNISGSDGFHVWSTGTIGRSMEWAFMSDNVCENEQFQVSNSAVGYDSYQWFMDGASISTDTIPILPIVPPGPHDITLVAYYGGSSDTLTRTAIVRAPPPAVTVTPLSLYCWTDEQIQLAISGYDPSDELVIYNLTTGSTRTVNSNPYDWFESGTLDTARLTVQVTDDIGCLGLFSDTLIIPFNTEPMSIGVLTGPGDVCIDTNIVNVSTFTSASSTEDVDYVWQISPANAGTFNVISDTVAEVTWNPTIMGASVSLKLQDECGLASGSWDGGIEVFPMNWFAVQPQPQTVFVGDSIHLWVEPGFYPIYGKRWYRNGVQLGNGLDLDYYEYSAMPSHEGWYYNKIYQYGGCGWMYSDSVYVEVLLNTGQNEPTGHNLFKLWPNPANDQLNLEMNGKEIFEWKILDVYGRLVEGIDVQKQNSDILIFDIGHLSIGSYILSVDTDKGESSYPFIKL